MRKEGGEDRKIDSKKVDYAEMEHQVEGGGKTVRERTTMFGETRLEKLEREREKKKIEKRAREKVERGKKVTEKRRLFERGEDQKDRNATTTLSEKIPNEKITSHKISKMSERKKVIVSTEMSWISEIKEVKINKNSDQVKKLKIDKKGENGG